MVAVMAGRMTPKVLRRAHGRGAVWAATLAILALLAHVLVPLALAAPGLRGSDGRMLPLVLCRTAADPAGTPEPGRVDHAKPCVICQALHGSGIAPPPAQPALPARSARPVALVWPEAPARACRPGRICPPARAPPEATAA